MIKWGGKYVKKNNFNGKQCNKIAKTFNQVNVPLLEILNTVYFFLSLETKAQKWKCWYTKQMHCLARFLHASEACTCLSFLPSSLLYFFSNFSLLFHSHLHIECLWVEPCSMLCELWTNERNPLGTAARSYSWHFTIMNSHRRRIPKAETERKKEEGGKKEGRGNVIELPWKISIT